MNPSQKRTWAEVDLAALAHNYHALRSLAPTNCKFVGVVKANAYGHGAVPVATKLEELGADYLAVACLDEAVELRQAGITAPILILGITPPDFASDLLRYDITQAVGDLPTARALSQVAQGGDKPLKIHIKADTGMSRLGFLADEAHRANAVRDILSLCALPGLVPEGIFTHFANADGDEGYTMTQFTRFLDLLQDLAAAGRRFQIRHCAASAAVLNYPCTHLDMIRPGIALYGHFPAPGMEHTCPLKPVMSLKTRIIALRDLSAGTCVSYGCTARLDEESTLAVLPVGYADGLHRILSNQTAVSIQGHLCPVVGRICMDLCMVRVEKAWNLQVGDEAILFDGSHPIEVHADLAGTIQYELLCAVAPRVSRLYL